MAIREVKVRIEDKYIKWFSEIGKKDGKIAGGKGANLGEMTSIKMPVPPGFVVISEAYSFFLEETGLGEKIYAKLKEIDVEDTKKLEGVAAEIREMIENAEMPKELEEEIIEAYGSLNTNEEGLQNASLDALNILKMSSEPAFVAIRSSATAEDTETASFAGQQETFLNVKGNWDVIKNVKKCWASLFTARSIYYRVRKGFKHEEVLIAVVIQAMINSDKSGVIFSKNPVSQDENIIVEAVFGLGEGIVSGRIKPDHYIVSRELKILEKDAADKKIAIVRNSSGKEETVRLTEDRSKSQVLSDYEIKRLTDYAITLEKHYNKPQDIEFAIETGEIYIVQTRPITTLEKISRREEIEGKEILSGQPASPGVGSGEVKIIMNLADLNKIKKGDILVTKMTNPDMVITMQKSSAIVTDEGGMTAHAAIVSREMGIPCIVGTEKATKILKDGMIITVDGFNGKIYEGEVEELKAMKAEVLPIVETKTKIKVMADLPGFASRAAETKCREIGLLRLEGIIAESGKHPYSFLDATDKYEDIIFSGISKIAKYFDSLWIRTSDIRTDEFKNLKGSKEAEQNPMLGMHGIRAGLKYKEILKAELKAMHKLGKSKKVGVMMPQIISADEVRQVKEILKELKIDNLKLGVMIETPAAVQIIEDLCREGIGFISFGTNDLTQYTLAIDRGNKEVQYLYDEMNPAVLRQLAYVIDTCKKYNVETSICGQAGSKKEMVRFLVKQGIDSISVNADKAREISEFVKKLEDEELAGDNMGEYENKKIGKDGEDGEDKEAEVEERAEKDDKKEDNGKEDGREEDKKIDEFGRTLHLTKCTKCSKETEVPFKPAKDRPVYCNECFKNVKREKKKAEKNIHNIHNSQKASSGQKEVRFEKKKKTEEAIKEKEKSGEAVENLAEGGIESVDNLEHLKEEEKKVLEQVQEEKNEKEKENTENTENIVVETEDLRNRGEVKEEQHDSEGQDAEELLNEAIEKEENERKEEEKEKEIKKKEAEINEEKEEEKEENGNGNEILLDIF